MCCIVHLKGSCSFSSAAVQQFGYCNTTRLGVDTFAEVCQTVIKGAANIGVLPIENSLAGSIHQVYDLLTQHKLTIIAETYVPIHLALMGCKGTTLQQIQSVVSHSKAIEQCEQLFNKYPYWTKKMANSTDAAAKMVAANDISTIAAIAAPKAAKQYNLEILSNLVQDLSCNHTRFIAITSDKPTFNGNKISLAITLPHSQGSLLKLLTWIARYEANLLKIESRPIKNKPFEYQFYLDLRVKPKRISSILNSLKNKTITLQHLGTFMEEKW